MESPASHHAHRCSFHPDRRDPYLRLSTITVFVRDQEKSLRFYLDQLGFSLAFDDRTPSGARWLAVSPPDGTAMIQIVVPEPGSQEHTLIGRPTHAVFLTDNFPAQFNAWRERGVRLCDGAQAQPPGAEFANFEDPDGNVFTLLTFDKMTQELDLQRQAHTEKWESERRLAQELELARQIQARLFPQTPPALKSLDCRAVCIPAQHIGGDYYDFLELGRGKVGLVIGDVSGKGTAAALLMANLQAHLRSICSSYSFRPYVPFALDQPARFLQAVNRLFYESTPDNAYTSLFFGEYDDESRRLRYANCGHPSALLLRHQGDLERLDSTSALIGLSNSWSCGVGELLLGAGDVLVLYTDGVSESTNDAGEEFGEARLRGVLGRDRDLPLEALLSSLTTEVQQFSGTKQQDDTTLIVARCTR